ncbi:MAG: membrane protein insertase YidC [bacterium]
MRQERFILALVISAAILIGWNYLFPAKAPVQTNSNAGAQQNTASTQPTSQPSATPTPQAVAETAAPDNVPQRVIHVQTPLYDVTLDSQGAVATSWIIRKNRNTGKDLYSASSTKNDPKPLELIPTAPPGVKPELLTRPFRVITGDPKADAVLAQKNFTITGGDSEGGSTLNIPTGSNRIQFVLHDDATALDVTKTITFHADRYVVELAVDVKRSGQTVSAAKLAVGPNIGDQGISHYTFYSVAPEGVAATEGQLHRLYAQAIHKNDAGWFSDKRPEGADLQIVGGAVDWAGIGDTYFAMVAIPSEKTQGLEFRTVAYEHEVSGKKEETYLITAFVPVPANGRPTLFYAGPKDHDLLQSESRQLSQQLGRPVDLDGVVNYGRLSIITKPLAVPILWSIKKLQALTGSYGVAIILFTILIYSLFFPLKWQSSRKMKKAQKYAPRMKELQEKIKGMKQNDPRLKELQVEQLRLMKEANPLGGCLPLLIQMPFLFALYSAITISIDFRQASFLWIPDLSAAEPHLIHILPLLMAGSMIVLQLITPAPSADPLQRKMMAIGMPLFMLYILWSAPAGLLVYWLVGNVVGFVQQFVINRLTTSEDDDSPPPAQSRAKPGPTKKLSPARV